MSYLSLYRKYRSQDFQTIVGQKHIIQTLENAIKSNRLAHAYIFAGPRGTGKTSMARILAKALNCRQGPSVQPCLKCDLCEAIKNSTAIDIIEIDAASNRGIDEIRQLREQVNFVPAEAKYKVYIIDEVHMLTAEAFNALLKTIEEPPEYTLFILATTEVQKIPATIVSRCQRLDFKRISNPEIIKHLQYIAVQEQIQIAENALKYITRISDGGMRDAISLLDQLISYRGKNISYEDVLDLLGSADFSALYDLAEILAGRDLTAALNFIEKLIAEGKNIIQLNKELLEYLRNLIFAKVGALTAIELSSENIKRLQEQANKFTLEELKKLLLVFARAESDMRWQSNAKIIFELSLIESCSNLQSLSPVQPLRSTLITKKEQEPPEIIKATPLPELKQKPSAITEPGETDPVEDLEPGQSNMPIAKLSTLEFKRSWPEVLNRVKVVRPKLYILLCDCEPVDFSDNIVTLKFKDNFGFHKEKLLQDENKTLLEKILQEIYKQSLKLNAVLEKELNPGGRKTEPIEVVKESKSGHDEHTQKLLDIFQGRVRK